MTTAVETMAPLLRQEAQELVDKGWFKDMNTLIEEAVRRYLETHSAELMDRFVMDDIAWGLKGHD